MIPQIEEEKKKGRKRILSDEDRKEKNRDKSKRVIKFAAPEGFKDDFQDFIKELGYGNMTDFIYKSLSSNQNFKQFLKNKRAKTATA